ncbi:MAG TPA: glycosyltransferase, partial [Roseiflexaceae bacterium]|nr:glycosyltransferase [Roseiflexaceae bacterium]
WEHLDKWVLRSFDGVVAVSGQIEQELSEAGVSMARLRRIENGIDAPARNFALGAAIRREFSIPVDEKLIVQIGRLAPSKRNDLLLDALVKLPARPHVIFVGEGEQRAALDRRIAELGIGARVHFAGYRTDILSFLSAANVLAISSDHEGLPIVLLEAMAAECPVVSTRVGDIGNVIADGRDAWLVTRGDVNEFGAALGQAIADNAQASARAASALIRFQLGHSREAMGGKYLELYEKAWLRRCR